MTKRSNLPTKKVAAAGVGGAFGIVLCALIPGTESPELAAAITTLCSFGLGYLVKES